MRQRSHAAIALAALGALVVSVVLFGPVEARAGTPSSGTISQSSPSLAYTAGPFAVAVADPSVCDVLEAPCDTYTLTVDTPAGFETTNSVKVVTSWAERAADFDLYVLDAAGNTLTSSATGQDPEAVLFPAQAGTYTLLVVPFDPMGQTFSGTITFSDKLAAGASSAPAWYRNYPAPQDPQTARAGEPSIAANWRSGAILFQSDFWTYLVSGFDPSSNASTWTDRTPTLPGCVSELSLDPIGFGDNVTGRYFNTQLLFNPALNSETCFTDDDGLTWTQSEGGGLGQSVDHETVGGGPFKPGITNALGLPVGPTTSYPHAVYYCSQDLVLANCSRSDDGGKTFNPSVTIYTVQSGCSGLHGHVKVAPNGTVYVPNKGCGGGQGVIVSLDNGQTWAPREVPGTVQAKSDPSVGIGANGTVYFGYVNGDGRPRIAVSHDEGITWTDDHDVGAALGIENTVFPAVVAGDDDRAAFAFLGTTAAGNHEAADFTGVWQVYVAETYDGGQTWTTTTVDRPNDPVQVGCIWESGGDNDCRNLLDFMGADVDAQGVVYVGYADGCVNQCVSDPKVLTDAADGYRTSYATIARQIAGRPLFAAFDPRPDLAVSDLQMGVTHSRALLVAATIRNDGAGDAGSFVVRFSDGARSVDVSVDGLAAGGSAKVSAVWQTRAENGTYTITATADTASTVAETDETNNALTRTFAVNGKKVRIE